MRGTRILLPLLLVALGAGIAEAQFPHSRRPIQRLDKWLGIGNGPGNHWKNPGHDSSYYNSWSANNTGMVSRSNPAAAGVYRFDDPNSPQFVPKGNLFQYPPAYEQRADPSIAPGIPPDSAGWNFNTNSGSQVNSYQSPMRMQQQPLTLPIVPARPASSVWQGQPPLTFGDE